MVDNTERTLVQKLIDQRDLTLSRVVDNTAKSLMELTYNNCIAIVVEDQLNRADIQREQAEKAKALDLSMVNALWGNR